MSNEFPQGPNVFVNTGAEPAKEKAPIDRESERLSYIISDLDDSIRTLVQMIDPVLGPIKNHDIEEPKAGLENSSLANYLCGQNVRLAELNSVLRRVASRVEL